MKFHWVGSDDKALSRRDLERLLQDGQNLRCVTVSRDYSLQHTIVQREEAIDVCVKHGAILSGPIAREHNYGVCFCLDDGKTTFVETKHQ